MGRLAHGLGKSTRFDDDNSYWLKNHCLGVLREDTYYAIKREPLGQIVNEHGVMEFSTCI